MKTVLLHPGKNTFFKSNTKSENSQYPHLFILDRSISQFQWLILLLHRKLKENSPLSQKSTVKSETNKQIRKTKLGGGRMMEQAPLQPMCRDLTQLPLKASFITLGKIFHLCAIGEGASPN